MQLTTSAYQSVYQRSVSVKALPRVVIEWNHNRFSKTVTPSNGGDTTDNINFPISSIAHAIRGRKGIVKARTGEARTYRSRENNATQYRTVGANANYKYWTSPAQANSSGGLSGVAPQVIYGASVLTNKIVIGMETTVSTPTAWNIQTTTDAVNWVTVADQSNTTINSTTGQVIIYLQAGDVWSTTPNDVNSKLIRGVRFNASRMSVGLTHFNMIEISARLERDLSEFIISASTSRSTDEASMIFPVGQMTSNTADVVIDNTDKLFDRDNTASPYYGLIDTNAEIRLFYGTDTSDFGGGWEYISQGVYYVDNWGDSTSESTVSLSATDFSKFFQSMQMNTVLFINRTPGQIVSEILSSVGFKNYSIDVANLEGQPVIPYVWFTDETNVWEAIQSICSSTQGTIFTDETGLLRYRSRDKTFEDSQAAPIYNISAVNSGEILANLESVEHNFDVEANKVVINYKPLIANSRKIAVDKVYQVTDSFSQTRRENRREYDTIPIDSVLWKPEDTITLRASQLQATITPTQNFILIEQATSNTWPWNGFVNVEGEIISYDGKEYRWWQGGVHKLSIVKNREEQKKIDDLQSDFATAHRNAYTGRLQNVTRGVLGTVATKHSRDLSDWAAYRKNANQTIDSVPIRMTHRGSQLILNGYAGDGNETYTIATRGPFTDAYKVYGTRLKFAGVPYHQGTAGLFFHMQGDQKTAYYVEMNLTSHALKTMAGSIAEFRTYRMNGNGSRQALPNNQEGNFGKPMPIVRDKWIDIDVTYEPGIGLFRCYIDGRLVHSFSDPNGTLPPGTWGPFVRGHSIAAFEYFYVCNTVNGQTPDIEKSSFQHKITGGFASGFPDRETSRQNKNLVNWFFDDFGAWVHEMRKFEIKFDKVPALDANVFLSNTWDAYIIEANRTAFDASFWISNAGRDNSVLNGDDPSVFVGGGDVKQQLLLYGQLITEEEESSISTSGGTFSNAVAETGNKVTYSNEYAIRKRGTVELSLDSNWIQSKSQAEAIGKWITDHWSEPVDNISVSGFFSPAIQLGDLVSVDYPERNMFAAQHRYHVVGINFGFNQGISTSLNLRRVR